MKEIRIFVEMKEKQMTYREALLGLAQTFRFTQFVKHFASIFVAFR